MWAQARGHFVFASTSPTTFPGVHCARRERHAQPRSVSPFAQKESNTQVCNTCTTLFSGADESDSKGMESTQLERCEDPGEAIESVISELDFFFFLNW